MRPAAAGRRRPFQGQSILMPRRSSSSWQSQPAPQHRWASNADAMENTQRARNWNWLLAYASFAAFWDSASFGLWKQR
eukprot:2717131-Pyramimonas_sp.AAC.1